MEYILDLLNKIKHDGSENPKDYTIHYYDRIEDSLKELKFEKIKKIEPPFLEVLKNNEIINIPLHRIKKVRKKGKIVWKR